MRRPQFLPERGTMPDVFAILGKTKFKDDDWDKPVTEYDPTSGQRVAKNKVSDKERIKLAFLEHTELTPEWVLKNLSIPRLQFSNYMAVLRKEGYLISVRKSRKPGNTYCKYVWKGKL